MQDILPATGEGARMNSHTETLTQPRTTMALTPAQRL